MSPTNSDQTPANVAFREAASRPKLLDQVRHAIRIRHYSRQTEQTYVAWIRRVILFHWKKHPATMGAPEIGALLSWLATNQRVSASTQNQALSALLFLYKHVLRIEIGPLAVGMAVRVSGRSPVSGSPVGTAVLNRGGLGVRSPLDRL